MAKTETLAAGQLANHFSLSGHGIHVDYSVTSISGKPLLNYHDSARSLNFIGDQIRIVEVGDLGSVVSVTLNITVDVGSTSFSLLVPRVLVGAGGSAHVTTDGITTTHKTPFAPPFNIGQRDLYHVTALSGTANFIVS